MEPGWPLSLGNADTRSGTSALQSWSKKVPQAVRRDQAPSCSGNLRPASAAGLRAPPAYDQGSRPAVVHSGPRILLIALAPSAGRPAAHLGRTLTIGVNSPVILGAHLPSCRDQTHWAASPADPERGRKSPGTLRDRKLRGVQAAGLGAPTPFVGRISLRGKATLAQSVSPHSDTSAALSQHFRGPLSNNKTKHC